MSTATVLKASPAQKTGNPYLEGNFAPVLQETTAFDLPVTGQIPVELQGRFARIGPNPAEVENPATYHWFMGSGMVHGLRLNGGKAEWYRNRWVVSDEVAQHLERPALPGPRNGPGRNAANTNIVTMGGRTYAIVEAGGLPVELTYGLESVARANLQGSLAHGFTAHPKYDPESRVLHALAYQPGLGALTYMTVNEAGTAQHRAEIVAPHCPMVHDVAFTSRYLTVLDLPVEFDMKLVGKTLPFRWNDRRTPRIGLLPKNGDTSKLVWVEAPSCYVFHIMNAFDDGNDVVMDVARHPRMFDREMRGPAEGATRFVRWRIDPTKRTLSETVLEERGCEFPRFNDAFAGKPYQHGYTVAHRSGEFFGSTYKHDLKNGSTQVHDYGPGKFAQEPVFVAREKARSEDDGYVMSYVHDANRNAGEVVILDAQDFTGKAIATIQLPARVPFGFHGNWLPDSVVAQTAPT